MAKIHSEQIRRLTEREDLSPLGYIFDAQNILVGTIDDTSESALAIGLVGHLLCDEEYPESGDTGNEHYYRLCDRLQQMGYSVLDAEWWRQRIEPGYSIEAIPFPGVPAPQEKPLTADPYGCVRCATERNSQSWLLMNKRETGWQSSAIQYPTLPHLLLREKIRLIERCFDEYGIYWSIASTDKPNILRAVYLGQNDTKRWKGDLAPGLYPMGTEGLLKLEYSTDAGCYQRMFTPLGERGESFVVLSNVDQVYLHETLPP